MYFCIVNRNQIIEDIVQIGQLFKTLSASNGEIKSQPFPIDIYEKWESAVEKEIIFNGWFEAEYVKKSLGGISTWLKKEALENWIAPYPFQSFTKKLALITAGNIPLVGFHDFLCGLLSGFQLQIKQSSDDTRLFPLVLETLCFLNPKYTEVIVLNPTKLEGFDAVIGTGTDSTLLHFKSYFKNRPHLLRGNRTSIAILNGSENNNEIKSLGNDIFDYFGRGCRNVTHLLVPKGYDFSKFFEGILPFHECIQNKKYGNNYDYNKAIHLMNLVPILDNNFLLICEDEKLHAPLAMIYYHYYSSQEEVKKYINQNQESIQCIIGDSYIPFGCSQIPEITDYADGVNTLSWLENPTI